QQLDRAVVVRRPEATGDEQQVGLAQPDRERLRELFGAVADDRDPGRLEAEAHQLGGEEGAVEVVPVAADELAARHDDRRARPAQRAGTGVVPKTPRAVTTICAD